MVSGLLTVVFLAVAQFGLALHVRNTVIDSAVEGARFASLGDRSLAEGEERTRELISRSVGERYATDVRATEMTTDGRPLIAVTVRTPLPIVGLLGPPAVLSLSGHALAEDP